MNSSAPDGRRAQIDAVQPARELFGIQNAEGILGEPRPQQCLNELGRSHKAALDGRAISELRFWKQETSFSRSTQIPKMIQRTYAVWVSTASRPVCVKYSRRMALPYLLRDARIPLRTLTVPELPFRMRENFNTVEVVAGGDEVFVGRAAQRAAVDAVLAQPIRRGRTRSG